MALDAIYLSALTRELAEKITGAKIDKVQQPERDQLLLSLRSRNGNCRLLISAGTGTAPVETIPMATELNDTGDYANFDGE